MHLNRRTLLRSGPALALMSAPLWLAACQPAANTQSPKLKPLPDGLREAAWPAEASAGAQAQTLQQHVNATSSQLAQSTGQALAPLLPLQAAADADMNLIANAYAQRLGDGWDRFDDQRFDTTAVSWRRGPQALLLAWTQKPVTVGDQATRLVLLGSNFGA